MVIIRTDEEIRAVVNLAHDGIDGGTKWRGMSYEQGIIAMIDWLQGGTDDNPMIDEYE